MPKALECCLDTIFEAIGRGLGVISLPRSGGAVCQIPTSLCSVEARFSRARGLNKD